VEAVIRGLCRHATGVPYLEALTAAYGVASVPLYQGITDVEDLLREREAAVNPMDEAARDRVLEARRRSTWP
jgi:hypothetical protein